MTKRRTLLINGLLVVALAGTGFGIYQAFVPAAGDAQAQARTTPVSVADVAETVSAAGTVASAYTANADFAVSGKVASVEVKVGDTVTTGQRLATLDSRQAKKQLEAAKSALDAAEEAAEEDNAALQSKVDQAELEVETAQAALDGTTLKAPGAGTVTAINGEVGQQAGSSGQSGETATSFVVITDLSTLVVETSVAEVDTGKVKAGQSATVSINALPGTSVAGTVDSLALTSSESGDTVTYPAKLTLANQPDGLRPGQSASVTITVAEAKDALAIPAVAVQGNGSVIVRENGQDVPKRVELGVRGQALVQVVSGLKEGDLVVLTATTGQQATGVRR